MQFEGFTTAGRIFVTSISLVKHTAHNRTIQYQPRRRRMHLSLTFTNLVYVGTGDCEYHRLPFVSEVDKRGGEC
jgi:hypothetical protein